MRTTLLTVPRLAAAAALVAVALAPPVLSAQSTVDASEAQAFMGAWVISMETEFGPFSMNLDIEDQDGKVAASIGSPEMGPEMQSISDISKEGESLVMMLEVDAQGQFFDISITVEPDGDNLAAWIETAGGEFAAGGVGTRREG